MVSRWTSVCLSVHRPSICFSFSDDNLSKHRASINFQTQESQTSYTSDLEVPQENLGSPTFSALQQAGLCFAKHRFLFQCHTESS